MQRPGFSNEIVLNVSNLPELSWASSPGSGWSLAGLLNLELPLSEKANFRATAMVGLSGITPNIARSRGNMPSPWLCKPSAIVLIQLYCLIRESLGVPRLRVPTRHAHNFTGASCAARVEFHRCLKKEPDRPASANGEDTLI